MGEIIKAHRVAKDFHLYKSWANFRLWLMFFPAWIFFPKYCLWCFSFAVKSACFMRDISFIEFGGFHNRFLIILGANNSFLVELKIDIKKIVFIFSLLFD